MTRYRSFVPSTGTFVVVPEENEKSEPFSNRKQVRIFLVWWAQVSRRAALLKKPHRGFFARRDASAGPQLFESTREGVTLVFCKRKRPAYFLRWSFWWARVSRRAALLKKPHWGFFARRDASAGPQLFESTREGVTLGFLQKKKTSVFSTLVFLVGAGGFEQAALSPVASCLRSIQWFHAAFRTPTRTAVASTRTAVRIKVGYKVG